MYKVLIVEDHALIRFGLRTALESKEYIDEIYEAPTAEDAINIINNKFTDVVIMDLGLPLMNGIEASKEIKKINPQIKIIILTSHDNKSEVIEAIRAGASAYCSKDINPDKLADVVLSVMEGALWFDSKISDAVLNALKEEKHVKELNISDDYNLTD
ncbi:MAG: response regulator transcription factor, partial [Candidatus Gastranaerophilales bacterium]|nr:response regulator transcription factor [Candidatus Gastranaerophilales bacterium]